jgi:hypothetical protein
VQPRDVFDGLLLALLGAAFYVHFFGTSISAERVDALLAVLLAIDLRIYLVGAGVLGIVFVGYIAVYLPQKQAGDLSP